MGRRRRRSEQQPQIKPVVVAPSSFTKCGKEGETNDFEDQRTERQ
jgi:hypothetical protein